MDYQILKPEMNEGILWVIISRPEALNALNTRFFEEMNALMDEYEGNEDLRVMVLTGEGKAFVAGADIAEMVHKNEEEGSAFSEFGQRTFDRIEAMPFPVIAAINGFALGGGCELAMSCDFRVAGTKAKFGQPEVNLGLIPGYAGTQRLSRLTNLGDALYLLTTADMIGAEDALRMGLVQKVIEQENLLEEVRKMAQNIASKGPKAVRKVKAVTRQGYLMPFDEGEALERVEFGSLFGNEGTEGMKAFLEKRKPNW
jgi:enoyl-CoA hydratase